MMESTELLEIIKRGEDSSHRYRADETPVFGVTIDELDISYFNDYFQRRFGKDICEEKLPLEKSFKI